VPGVASGGSWAAHSASSRSRSASRVVPFSSAHAGSREKDETFLYDVDKDPAGLIAEGKVERADKPKAEAGK